jgi:hypothetical protein
VCRGGEGARVCRGGCYDASGHQGGTRRHPLVAPQALRAGLGAQEALDLLLMRSVAADA